MSHSQLKKKAMNSVQMAKDKERAIALLMPLVARSHSSSISVTIVSDGQTNSRDIWIRGSSEEVCASSTLLSSGTH